MSSTYAGNAANNPIEITIPSDGDGPIKAADVNPALCSLLDLIRHNNGTLVAQIFTADGTYTPDANCTGVWLIGYGGGGGGGTGAGNGVSTNEYWCGGGGGGGALQSIEYRAVTPGTPYAVAIGAGGTGGVGGSSFSPGTSGGDTTFGSLATFKGAFYGTSATNAGSHRSTASTAYMLAHGGKPTSLLTSYHNIVPANFGFTAWDTASVVGFTALALINQIIGEGGCGGTSNYLSGLGAGPGAPSNVGSYAGGARGAKGNDSGSYRGGGGGGGGAAGPGGAGGAGGAGSNANTSGASTAGSDGASAPANSGAGGGGGGAAGAANAGVGGFANYNSSGGNGGSGKLIVVRVSSSGA